MITAINIIRRSSPYNVILFYRKWQPLRWQIKAPMLHMGIIVIIISRLLSVNRSILHSITPSLWFSPKTIVLNQYLKRTYIYVFLTQSFHKHQRNVITLLSTRSKRSVSPLISCFPSTLGEPMYKRRLHKEVWKSSSLSQQAMEQIV